MLRSELKRLARGSAIYGIGGVLQRFIGLLLLPLFTRALSPADYGVLALVGVTGVAVTGFYNLGTANSMGVLYFREQDPQRRPPIIWSNAVLLLCNAVLLTGLLAVAAPQISELVFQTPRYAAYLRIAFTSVALVTLMDPFYSFLRMEEKARLYVALTLASALITLALSAIFVLVFHWGVPGMLLAALVTNAMMAAAVFIVIVPKVPYGIDRTLFGPLVRVGFPSIYGLFAFLIIDFADRQLVQRFLGLEQLGVYSIGYSFGMLMLVLVSAFGTAWPPFFMSFVNRRDDAKLVFGRVLKYYVLGLGFVAVLFFAAARPVVELLLAPAFREAAAVIGLVATAYMLKGCYLILLPGIYYAGKLQWQSAIEWIAALLNIGLNLLWIERFGLIGAAAATVLSYLSLTVLSWLVAKRYLDVEYDWGRIGVAVAGLALTASWLFRVSYNDSVGEVIALSLSAVTALFLVLTWAVLGRREREFAFSKVRLLFTGRP